MAIKDEQGSSNPESKNPAGEDEVQNLDELYDKDGDDEIDIHPIEHESSAST